LGEFTKAAQRRITASGAVFQHSVTLLKDPQQHIATVFQFQKLHHDGRLHGMCRNSLPHLFDLLFEALKPLFDLASFHRLRSRQNSLSSLFLAGR
jgi:hypothetical protein